MLVRWWEPVSSPGAGGHTKLLRVMACVPVAGGAHSPDGVSYGWDHVQLEDTLNVRTKSCSKRGIAQSGGGVRANTQAMLSEGSGIISTHLIVRPFCNPLIIIRMYY